VPFPNRFLFGVAAIALAAVPAEAGTRRAIAIAPGTLGHAINELSRQTGASIRLADASLWRTPARGAQGQLTVREALERIVAGSGARVIALGGDGWEIAPPPPRLRPRVEQVSDPLPAAVASPSPTIIVTASKRGTRLGDYPGSVTILSGEALGFGAGGPADSDAIVNRAADVTSTHLGPGRNKLFVRGIADSGLVGQSQATVGEYFGDIRLSYNAPDPDLRLYDVSSVEILEGPQGTLYGAGSPGGIIRIVPNAPVLDRFEGYASGGVTSVAHGDMGGDAALTLNLPIVTDRLGVRLVGYGAHDGGYIDEVGGGKNINAVDTAGGRALLKLDAGDGWMVEAGFAAQDINAADSQYADLDAPPLTRRSRLAQPYSDAYRMAALTIVKDWDGLRFTSSNGWVRQGINERFDASETAGQPRLFRQWTRTRMLSTENRLARPMADGWGWVAGASYVVNDARIRRAFGAPGEPVPSPGVVNHVEEGTLYGELSIEPIRGLTLTGGGRLTHSRLSGHALDPAGPMYAVDFRAQQARSETKLLPSASASIEPAPGLILFTRYQQGFRPGGLAVGDELVRRFRSDRVATTELGFRYGKGGESALSLAASLAYTRWNDIQADYLDSLGLPVTTNIGDGRIWSFDARVGWAPLWGLKLDASFIYNDGRLTRPDETQLRFFPLTALIAALRQPLPNVAEYGGRLGARYTSRIGDRATLTAEGWARYIGKSRLGVGPMLGGMQGGTVDTGLSLRLARGRYGLTLSAANLLDKVGNRFALGTPLDIDGDKITPLQPRTIRLGFDVGF